MKQRSVEEIISKLREAEVVVEGAGEDAIEAYKAIVR